MTTTLSNDQTKESLENDLYPEGVYRIEVADYWSEVDPDEGEGSWIEFRPLCRVQFPGPLKEQPNLHGKNRAFFTAKGNSTVKELIRELRDLCLPQPAGKPGPDDVHGLKGRQIVAECVHASNAQANPERWSFRAVSHSFPQLGCTCATCIKPHEYPIPGCKCSRCRRRFR
jgi:hypothetical protein